MTSRRAFTLIELLIVIAIIAILPAILFLVFSQALAAVQFPAPQARAGEWPSNHAPPNQAEWWHWGGARNYVFVDGHVRYLRAQQIHPAADGLPDVNLTKAGVSGRDVD